MDRQFHVRPCESEVAMWKEAKIVSFLAFFLFAGFTQEKKKAEQEVPSAGWKIPPEEAQRQNPVKPTKSSMADGKRIYGIDCEMCHGKEGNGKGDLVQSMELKLRDYRDPAALKDMTDGELYYTIAKGRGKMPGEEDRWKPEQIWHMVNYIRSLAQKEPPPKPKE
jgi:mono/diheme cytochrome c family protein